jgi:hypothetical protein
MLSKVGGSDDNAKLLHDTSKSKAVPLHAMEALGGEEA